MSRSWTCPQLKQIYRSKGQINSSFSNSFFFRYFSATGVGKRGTTSFNFLLSQSLQLSLLDNNSKILDVGCGKGFLLYEIKLLLPKIEVRGFDSSKYALDNSKEEVKQNLFCHQAQEVYPFQDKEYDLTISINTLHNLKIFDLSKALKEIQRVSKNSYICVESFRNDLELFNLECWALTCQSFFSPDEWIWIYNQFGYQGDYEFIYFE